MSDISPDYDLAIIGGGINGVGIARDAAGRGLRVLLLESRDLASATSSASSKLIHGGLRYLEHFEFRLVRESLAEREILLRTASNLVQPLRLIIPSKRSWPPRWIIRAGLFLYDRLGGANSLAASEAIELAGAPAGMPLRREITRGFAFSDCRADDARLVIATARDAAERGAQIQARTECIAARRAGDIWRVAARENPSGMEIDFTARALVNAAGPWAATVCTEIVGIPPRHRQRLVKGSHVVVPRLYDGEQAYLLLNEDGRIVFVIPFHEQFTLIGTTEIPVAGPPDAVSISQEEIAYLQHAVELYFERGFSASEVVWSFAGVRPLLDDGSADPSAVTRGYVFEIDGEPSSAPLLSVFGGKLTTYRRLAERALENLRPWFPDLPPSWTASAALPDAPLDSEPAEQLARAVARWPNLPRAFLRRLLQRHGSAITAIIGAGREEADLGRHFGGSLYECEVLYFLRHEWARSAEDILWRRTKEGLYLTPVQTADLSAYLEGPAAQRAMSGTSPLLVSG